MTRAARSRCAAVVAVAATVAGCVGDDGSRPTPTSASSTRAPGPGDTVDPGIARVLDRTLPRGADGTVVVVRDGTLVHCAGFGEADHEQHVPATCDTGYDVMSLTKQFTAAAVLTLQMQGRLDVDAPIGDYLGPVPADKRAVTVHHLLTHTAGLVEAVGPDYEPLSRDDLVARALATPLVSPPGSGYHYSNVGYSLLAAIVEEVSGTGYEEYLDTHLFAPAGMTSTGYVGGGWSPGQVAVEYDARGEPQGHPFDHPWAADGPYWNLRGNGGLISTARDLARWHEALEGDDVLDPGAKARLFEPHVLEEPGGGSSYGYGWVVQESPFGTVAAHDGGNAWSYAELVRLLDRDTMVFVVTNQARDERSGANLVRLAPDLLQRLVVRLER